MRIQSLGSSCGGGTIEKREGRGSGRGWLLTSSASFGLGIGLNNAKRGTALVIYPSQFAHCYQPFELLFDLMETTAVSAIDPITNSLAIWPGLAILKKANISAYILKTLRQIQDLPS